MSHMKRLLDSHPHVECEVMSESQKITINTLNDQNQELLEALERLMYWHLSLIHI